MMGYRSRQWAKSLTYTWLLRSQPGPLQDYEKADRILRDRKSVVKLELWRMGLDHIEPAMLGEDEDGQA